MHPPPEDPENRRLRLVTRYGQVEGQIPVNPRVSTLRYLNVTARSAGFIVLAPPIESSNEWNVIDGALALAFDSVLFVEEVKNWHPAPGDRTAAALYDRCRVRMSVGEYAVEGFLHLPPGGKPIARLNSDAHPFFALSAVSAMGPEVQFSAPFLAVRRSAVIAVQNVGKEVALEPNLEAEVVTTC